jgi:hypothetical protein
VPRRTALEWSTRVGDLLNHLSEHPDIDRDRYAEHIATVLLDGITEPTRRPPTRR